MDKKEHLVYMTGLSIDKNRMNNITKNIAYDKDFNLLFNDLQDELEIVLGKRNKLLLKIREFLKKGTGKITDANIEELLPILTDIKDDFLSGSFFDNKILDKIITNTISDELKSKVTELLKPSKIINTYIDKGFDLIIKNDDDLVKNHAYLYDEIKKYEGKIKKYKSRDFFSLYLSNQSDSTGIQILSKVSQKNNFNLEHSYCDRPFFDNKFIDHVVLEVDKSKLNENWLKSIKDTFDLHIYDILFSRIIKDESIEFDKESKQDKVVAQSLADLILNDNEKIKKVDVINTLSDRNLFGISLLSQVLYTIFNLSEEKDIINISEIENSDEFHFLKELLEMSTSTKNEIVCKKENDKSFINAKIYFSNGIMLDKKVDDLYNDDFFKYTNRVNNSSKTLDFVLKADLKSEIENIYKFTINEDSRQKLVRYISESVKPNKVYIKIPIKMMLSLPVDDKNNPNSNIELPSCLINDEEKNIDVLTIGGAEHNRALAHLINKHRLRFKDERLFGFMDNYFDFDHKQDLDKRENHQSAFNFFMGVNQPVSGWNFLLDQRVNDDKGNSVNSDAKFLSFKIKNDDKNINVVSIYGFSAIASALGTNMFIAEFLKREKKSFSNGLFSENFSTLFDNKQIYKEIGTTSTVFFYKNLKDIFDNKDIPNSLYENIEIRLDNITDNKEDIIEKLKDYNFNIVNETNINKDKFQYMIDKRFNDLNKEGIKILKLEEFKLDILKVILFYFKDKYYSKMFNDNKKEYLEKLNHQDGGLLISHIQHGRVTTKNT